MTSIPTQILGIQMGFPRTPPYSLEILEMESESSVEDTLSGDSGFSSIFAVMIMNFWVRNADPRGILRKPFATLFSYSAPITTTSSEIRRICANCNEFK